MPPDGSAAKPAPDDARRRRVLEAAVAVFFRYGYRKASMDEIARAAGLSRQGLYLSFATKEELFREGVRHVLATSLEAAAAPLADASLALEDRLVGAFDAWVGRFVGMMGGDASDLHDASQSLVGSLVAEHEARFTGAVAKLVRSSGLAAAYKPSGLGASDLAETLHATARGLKTTSASRQAFTSNMTLAVRALCFPKRTRSRRRRETA